MVSINNREIRPHSKENRDERGYFIRTTEQFTKTILACMHLTKVKNT